MCDELNCSTWPYGGANGPQQFTIVKIGASYVMNIRYYYLATGWDATWSTLCTVANLVCYWGPTAYLIKSDGITQTSSPPVFYPWGS